MMNGYQLTFFTQQDRRVHGMPAGDWLVHVAKEMGLHGATLFAGGEGFGRDHRIHSARFVELADQPIQVVMVLTCEEADSLLARLAAEKVHLFHVRVPAQFGVVGEPD